MHPPTGGSNRPNSNATSAAERSSDRGTSVALASWIFSDIMPGSFRWRSERSADGEGSRLGFDPHAKRRVKAFSRCDDSESPPAREGTGGRGHWFDRHELLLVRGKDLRV